MAIEWNRVDIALFDKLPRDDASLSVVVEAKKKGNACLSAQSQAEAYAQRHKDCRRLIVTDGIRYGVFSKSNDGFELQAYLNLIRLRDSYPVYNCAGAKEAILAMTPENVSSGE